MAYKSKFNYIYEKSPGEWIFFNTLTGALVILNDEYKNKYDSLPEKNIPKEGDFLTQMCNLGFVNDDDFDDEKLVDDSRKRIVHNDKVAYLRVLTTTGCNARCDYCYEKGFENTNMTIETSNQLVDYILSLPKLEKFYIHWFGGEPLLNTEIIDNVMSKVYDKLLEKGTKVFVYFTTNGSLIDPTMAKKASSLWHANWFQITIDGLKEEYDLVKKYVHKKYNFDKIIDNIGYLLENDITVILRINYFPNDEKKVRKIIDYIYNLYEEQCLKKKIIFSPAPIFEVFNERNIGIKKSKYSNLLEPNKYLFEKGLVDFNEAFGLNFKGGQCYACHSGSFVVNPDGKLYNCTVTSNEVETSVGNIYSGVEKNAEYYKWVSADLPEECSECVFLPLCQGGCKAGYLGYIDMCCKRNISEINDILNYKVSLKTENNDSKKDQQEIYLD